MRKPGDSGGLAAVLWSIALLMAAVLGWEHYARQQLPRLTLARAWYRVIGQPNTQITAVEIEHGYARWLGWIGACLLLGTLLYIPRKRLQPLFERFGSRQTWLDVHIFIGFLGYVFALYHTTFKVGSNLFALVFWACGLVVLTGLVGRYFHGQLARTQSGNEMRLEDARAETAAIEGRLAGLSADATAVRLDVPLTEAQRGRGLIGTAVLLFQLDVRRAVRFRALRARLVKAGQSRAAVDEIVETLNRKAKLEQNILVFEKAKKLASLWGLVHIAAAVAMFVFLAIHIYMAVRGPAGWI